MNWRGCRVPLGALSVERWEVQRVYCEFISWYTQTGGRRAYGGGDATWVGGRVGGTAIGARDILRVSFAHVTF